MKVAFYAPMKPPDHPVPSGDRRMARLLMAALDRAGYQVELASRLVTRDPIGDPDRQARLAALGDAMADRLTRHYLASAPDQRPRIWFTYHLYYKAPDWLGPRVCERLGLPYVVAEASVAPKRAGGPWDLGHRAVLRALERAAAVVTLNPADRACLPADTRVHDLKPFLDTALYLSAHERRAVHRATLAERLALDPGAPWIAVAAMMRSGDKLASYRLLARTLEEISDRPWCLLVAGDGPARADVAQALEGLGSERLRLLGALDEADLASLYGAADVMVWPAVNEAYGMALLEAQAAGLPVVAGATGGVPAIVQAERGGLLVEPGDASALAAATARLLGDPALRSKLSYGARETVQAEHGLGAAAGVLDSILREAVGGP